MKRLELIFKNQVGSNVTLSLDEPIEPVDPEKVSQTMDQIIEQDIFTSNGGDLVEKHQARIVERNVTEIDIIMD